MLGVLLGVSQVVDLLSTYRVASVASAWCCQVGCTAPSISLPPLPWGTQPGLVELFSSPPGKHTRAPNRPLALQCQPSLVRGFPWQFLSLQQQETLGKFSLH